MAKKKKTKHYVVQVPQDVQTNEARVTETGRVISDHPSHKITPSKLKTILEDAESGDITAQHELFLDIEERDSDIGANIQTRKRAILTLDWRIAAPRNATPQEEQYQAEIDEYFYQFNGLEDLLIDLMDAVGHGFSPLEINWQFVNEKWQPKQFIHRSQSWFKLDKDDNLLLKTPDNPMGEPLRPLGWVVHMHKSRSVQLARMGLFRTLAWLYMFKHYSVHDFAEFLELYGMPIRIGKYPVGATANEKSTLLKALAQIGHNAAGIMPDGMMVELHNAANHAGQNNPFLQMIDWAEKSIARMILGQTLTSGADGKSSTNALGNVHNEVRRDLLVSDAKQIAQTITQQIILPYLQVNVDPNITVDRIPRFEFDTKEKGDLSQYAEALPKLVEIGVQIPELWAKEKLGIPDVQEGEAVLKPVLTSFENENKTALKQTALSHSSTCSCGCDGRVAALNANAQTAQSQDILDQSLDEALTKVDFNAQLNPMLQTAVAALMACESFEQASEKLAEIYPDLNSQQHHQYLTQALFVAELLGASND